MTTSEIGIESTPSTSKRAERPSRLEIEQWRPIIGYERLYEVSNLGRIKQVGAKRPGFRNRLRATPITSLGYPMVCLGSGDTLKRRYVHQLVAAAFIGPRPSGREVNHVDGNKANSRVENLEYVTRSENMLHAYRTGLHRPIRKITDEQVATIRASDDNQYRLADRFGVSQSLVSLIKLGQRR